MADNNARYGLVPADLRADRIITPLELSGMDLNLIELALASRAQRFRARASEARRRDDLIESVREMRYQQNMDLAEQYQDLFNRITNWEAQK